MTGIARRRVLASMAAGALAAPGLIRAQGAWKPDKPVSYTHLTLPTILLV